MFLHGGVKQEEIVKLVMSNHNITYLDLNKKVELFNDLGYNDELFFGMLKKCPKLVNLSENNIKMTIDNLRGLGYDEDILKKMIIECPELLQYDFKRIENRFNEFKKFNYTNDQIIKITAGYPGVIGTEEKRFKTKLAYYNSIGLHDYIVQRPKDLIQSVELTHARYQFFIDNDIEINKTTQQSLFKKESSFIKQYGISKSVLLKLYNFSTYINSIKDNSVKKKTITLK